MPNSEHIIGLPYFQILKTVRQMRYLEISVKYTGSLNCPHCNSVNLRKKDTFTRRFKHISIGERLSVLIIKSHKYKCLDCKKYFNQRFPGIIKHRRSTEVFRREIYNKHYMGIDQKSLSKNLNIDVQLGRSEKSLQGYLAKNKAKSKVQVVCMDLSRTYKSIAQKYFPKAMIVTDRFHVVRLVNQKFMKIWKLLDSDGRKNRGLISLMRRHSFKLKLEQKIKLKKYLKSINGLESIYDFKQNFMKLILLKTQRKIDCKKYIPVFLQKINQLRSSNFPSLQALGETLNNWKEEIVRM